jgi:uncharacterized protein
MVSSASILAAPGVSPFLYGNKQKLKIMKTSTFTSLRIAIAVIAVLIIVSCGQKDNQAATDAAQTGKSEVKAPDVDIHTAVVTENADALKQHIAAGTNLNERDPFGGSSPLISACVFGKPDMAKILIDAGADINFQNNDGATPLHTAAFFCRPEIVKMLLEKNADKTLKNKYAQTPYDGVSAPFDQVKEAYDMMSTILGPMGLKLDYEYLKKTRPEIAEMLK